MSDVFVSYSREDQAAVENLTNDMRELGHTAWFDTDLAGGQSWWSQILENIRQCQVFVFALSPKSLQSVACTREFEYAHAIGKPILPVLIVEGVSINLLPEELAQIHFVQYLEPDKESAMKLGKALNTIPTNNALPDPLPPPPEVPMSYLGGLARRVSASEMNFEEQAALVVEIKQGLLNPSTHEDSVKLLQKLRKRRDLFATTEREINEILTQQFSQPDDPPPKPIGRNQDWKRGAWTGLKIGGVLAMGLVVGKVFGVITENFDFYGYMLIAAILFIVVPVASALGAGVKGGTVAAIMGALIGSFTSYLISAHISISDFILNVFLVGVPFGALATTFVYRVALWVSRTPKNRT